MARERSWSRSIIAARRSEQEALLARARRFVEELPRGIGLVTAVVFRSVVRGDFNTWSDVDVLVVADDLPPRPQDRLGLLLSGAPDRVQPVPWTADEFVAQLAKGNPIAREAVDAGIVLAGEERFRELVLARPR